MGSLKVTLCAGAALAAVCTPVAPTAYAADGGGVSVTPSSPAPGTDVTLRVPDCTERTAVAVSAAFESDVRLSVAAEDGVLVGSSTVRSTVSAGAYAVQGIGAMFIDSIHGSYTNVVGLPLALLFRMLRKAGLDPLKTKSE